MNKERYRTHDDVHLNDAAHQLFCEQLTQQLRYYLTDTEK